MHRKPQAADSANNEYKKYQDEKSDYTVYIKQTNNRILDLNSRIYSKKKELDKLKNTTVATGSPIVLGAGEYTVGDQIPSGRYRISGSSNFVVRTSSGRLLVNTILGNGQFGVENYTCILIDGNTVEADSKCTYLPVE